MGLFQNIFKKTVAELKPTPSAVFLPDLPEWLLVQQHLLLSRSKLEQELPSQTDLLKSHQEQLLQLLPTWQDQLPFRKMEEISQHIVAIKKMLKFSLPISPSFEQVQAINEQLLVSLENILPGLESLEEHDFIHELRELQQSCRQFQQKVLPAGLHHLQQLQQQIQILFQHDQEIIVARQNLVKLQQRLQSAQAWKEEKDQELELLKKNPLYSSIAGMQEQRSKSQERERKVEEAITLFFTTLKPILQHYSTTENSALLRSYLGDPLPAFMQDQSGSIVYLLQQIRVAVRQKKVELPSPQAEILFSQLEKVDIGHLHQLRQELGELQKELDDSPISLRNRDYAFKLEEATYRWKHFADQEATLQEEIMLLNRHLVETETQREQDQQTFEQAVNTALHKEIKLQFSS